MKQVYFSRKSIFAAILSCGILSSFAQTTSFTTPGGPYAYTATGSQWLITVNGAPGGNNSDYPSAHYHSPGGHGGSVVCTLAVTPGTVYYVYVGGAGAVGSIISPAAGGVNGGADGGTYVGSYGGGGGGGASDIRTASGVLASRLVVAGGGGGAGLDYVDGSWGGDGGDTVAQNGMGASSYTYPSTYGNAGGGSQTAGGGAGNYPSYGLGFDGSLGLGGLPRATNPGGGGGGGYYGGGGGVWDGAGGGSSYTDPILATSVVHTMGAITSGDGSVTIMELCDSAGTISGNAPLCAGSILTLSETTPGGSWVSSNPAVATVDPSTGLVTAISGGLDTITYNTAVALCSGVPATVVVTVNPIPTAYNVTVTNSGRYCAGGAGVHVGLDNSNLGISYQLYNGMSTVGVPMPGTDTAIDFGLDTAAGSYTVIATDTTTGCTNIMSGSATVVIVPVVVPSVSISINTFDTICAGTTTTFTASPVNGGDTPVYMWAVNGTPAGIDSTAYAYNPTNGNVVTVTMISSMECAMPDTVRDSITMTVLPVGNAAVSITATPNDTVCLGSPVTLTANPTRGGFAPFYIWIKNTDTASFASSFTYTPANGDNIYVIMFSEYLCPVSPLGLIAFSTSVSIDVETPIVPSVTITAHPGLYVGSSRPDTLVATVTNGGASPFFQWYLNGAPVGGATSSVWIQSHFNTNDSVSCMVTRNDACGLGTINSIVIHVGVGVPQVGANSNVSIMPNPNKGNFTIKGTLATSIDGQVSAEITNMLGQVVYSNKFIAKNGNIDEQVQLDNNMASGMYILNLHSEAGSQVFRFVIER